MASLLEELSYRKDAPADEEEIIRNAGAVAYAAGSETVCYRILYFSVPYLIYETLL